MKVSIPPFYLHLLADMSSLKSFYMFIMRIDLKLDILFLVEGR